MTNTDSEPKSKNDVYRERNLLALAFIRSHVDTIELTYGTPEYGWWPDRDSVNGEAWAVVWINLDSGGQVGWHVPMDMVPAWLPKRDPKYDGYTTDEKNARIADLVDVEK